MGQAEALAKAEAAVAKAQADRDQQPALEPNLGGAPDARALQQEYRDIINEVGGWVAGIP